MTRIDRHKTNLSINSALVRYVGMALGIAAPLASVPVHAQTLPGGGSVAAGSATITSTANSLTVNQTSQKAVLNWDSFSIGKNDAVTFAQPNSSAVALNRVTGADPSSILGSLSSNGKVFLVNPNGIVFGQGANVNVGGLVASTLDLSDADFMNGRYNFAGRAGSVSNEGSIVADGGYVALLGGHVDNRGVIRATLGTVALVAGTAVTLDVAGDGLLNVAVDKGAVGALVENGGLIQANGGQVMLTSQAAGALLRTVVNNTGIIEAHSFASRDGRIVLLGDMQSGTTNVAGTLDASAPGGGNGGFIETSAATVNVDGGARITTAATAGTTGTWLIDPADYTIGAGGNISGATLSTQLVTNNVTISTIPLPGNTTTGNGDIIVNDVVAWTASGTPTTLTMNAFGDVNINAAISATKGNIVACCGRDVVVNAPLTTVNGSISLSAGRDVLVYHAISTTDGNIRLCAGHDVHIDDAITLTRGSTIPAQSLNLAVGLTLIAGSDGTGPGTAGGTVIFAALAPPTTVTVAPVNLFYNPISYAAPTDYRPRFVLTEGATLTQRMLLFPNGDKAFDGTNTAVLNGFNTTATSGLPSGVTLVANSGATAVFDSSGVGTGIGITYSGYGLAGANADQYALADACCTVGARTRGNISAIVTPTPVPVPGPGVTPTPTPGPTPTPTPGSTPTPTPTPTPGSPTTGITPGTITPTPGTPIPGAPPAAPDTTVLANAQRPISGFAPVVAAPFVVQGIAIAGTGVRMPAAQLASLQVPAANVNQLPVSRAGTEQRGSAFLPSEVPAAPEVPVYPRKQARH